MLYGLSGNNIFKNMFSSRKTNSYVGIDIGTSSIKVVELKKNRGRLRLVSYGFTENINRLVLEDLKTDTKYIAGAINLICKKSGIANRNAYTALPTFSVFTSVLNLPRVERDEVDAVVQAEAKKVIPLPLEEMALNWHIINETEIKENKEAGIKVLLTGAPKILVKKYMNIFKEAGINLISLETETFSLIRGLLGNDKSTTMIVELGSSTTNISIIKESIPVLNRSLDVGGLAVTKAISESLNVGLERAEQFKFDMGSSSGDDSGDIPKTVIDKLSPIVNEVKYMLNIFQNERGMDIDKIVLSGGSAMVSNFKHYLSKALDMNIIIGDPWARVSYPLELETTLNELGPKMAVAIGLAMRGAE